jgi:hypothetical protein
MSVSPLENYIYALKNTVADNIKTALSAIEAEKKDGITLDDFITCEVGYNNVFGQRAYPVCFFYPANVLYEPSAIQAELVTFTVEIWFAIKHTVADSLTKKLMRYSDAVRTVIFENNTLGGAVIDTNTSEAEFWPGGADNSNMAAAKIVVTMISELRT